MGLITMNSAELVPNFISIDVEFSATGANGACNIPNTVTLYIPFGTTFSTTNVIWENSNGTGIPPAGWYSDTISSRQWDGVSFFSLVAACVLTERISLADGADEAAACIGLFNEYYIKEGETFETTLAIYTDIELTIKPPVGWYSDLTNVREWRGDIFLGTGFCP